VKKDQVVQLLKAKSYLDDRLLFMKTQVKQIRKINPKNPERPITTSFSAEAYLAIGEDTLYLVQHGMLGKPNKLLFEARFTDLISFEISKGPMGLSKDVQIANHEVRYQMLVMHKNKDMLEKMHEVALEK
jgi:hypothetical protein